MNKEKRNQREQALAMSYGVCEVCGMPLLMGQMQAAHRIGNTVTNRKKFGDLVIDSPLNVGYTCSLKCNAKLDISMKPVECLELAESIIKSKLQTLRGDLCGN